MNGISYENSSPFIPRRRQQNRLRQSNDDAFGLSNLLPQFGKEADAISKALTLHLGQAVTFVRDSS